MRSAREVLVAALRVRSPPGFVVPIPTLPAFAMRKTSVPEAFLKERSGNAAAVAESDHPVVLLFGMRVNPAEEAPVDLTLMFVARVPCTSSFSVGFVVPIPTSPVEPEFGLRRIGYAVPKEPGLEACIHADGVVL
jgi:hypothetical protein